VSERVDPNLRHEVLEFGGEDISKCMNCGNCTAVCSLSQGNTVFPRKTIRQLQLGLKDKLLSSAEPWLCYYCGECSDTCPRQAEPGETMMAARRYLTSQYDWTGLSRRLYISKAWEFGALIVVGLFVVALFYFFHGPMITDRVSVNTFAPVAWVEIGDWIMALLLFAFLASNAYRMYRYIMSDQKDLKIPFSLYLSELKTLFVHGATQKRWRECDSPTHWLKHLLLVTAYATMLLLVVVFLRWFQTDEIRPIWHPTRFLGYYATAVLLYFTVDAMISRLRRDKQIHKHSHLTDWTFLILLFLTTLSGIIFHLFRIVGLPLPTYYAYVVHLAIAVPMLVVEVPFGKWAHLAYRPLALYFISLKEKARELAAATPAVPNATTAG